MSPETSPHIWALELAVRAKWQRSHHGDDDGDGDLDGDDDDGGDDDDDDADRSQPLGTLQVRSRGTLRVRSRGTWSEPPGICVCSLVRCSWLS